MANKSKSKIDVDVSGQSEDGSEVIDSSSSSSQQKQGDEKPPEAGEKGPDAGHGNRYQSKLLMLYAMRAIQIGYQFYLGTELSVGEKFDDLIFHYRANNESENNTHLNSDEKKKPICQQYLQAKHRLKESAEKGDKVVAQHLLNDKAKHRLKESAEKGDKIMAQHLLNDKGDFSLLKYFQSYLKIRSRGNDIEHCIICTNIEFNPNDLKKHWITLEPVEEEKWPKMLDCKDFKKEQTCYKLKVLDNFKNISSERKKTWVMNCTGEEIKYLFNNCADEIIKNLFRNCKDKVNEKQFSDYTAGEIKELFNNFKDRREIKNFFQTCGQTIITGVFEGFLSFVDDFFDKLIFVTKTPNEDELDLVLAKEVGNLFKMSNAALPSAYVMNEMLNWFKKQDEKHYWLTAEEARAILNEKAGELMALSHSTSLSIGYQNKLKRVVEFNDSAVQQLTMILNSFWNNSQEKIQLISSETPKLTAVKVISAINKISNFSNQDDYLVTSSKHLKVNTDQIEKSLKENICHHLLVVVDKDAYKSLENFTLLKQKFTPDNSNKKCIWISNQNFEEGGLIKDIVAYGHLSDIAKESLGKKRILFQQNVLIVDDLIDKEQADEVMNSKSIENLLQMTKGNMISVPSFISSSFEKTQYIERKMKFSSKDHLLNELNNIGDNFKEEISLGLTGKIKWLVTDNERKLEIWEKFKFILKQANSLDGRWSNIVNENGLIDMSNKRIIITGVAGSGKSTILSKYYEKLKEAKSDNWIIKISLMNYSRVLLGLESVNKKSLNDFLVNNVIDQSAFAQSLLNHRLETGDRIVIMLDGFDEINGECQKKVIQLAKNLNESIPLYITTRPHMADELQFELSQLAYSLVNFTEDDQINFLTSIWKDYFLKEKIVFEEFTIRHFATKLIDKVSKTLKDKEKEFIGIPLQCRILAECFQSKIKEEIIQNQSKLDEEKTDSSHLLEGQQFDMASLYKMLMEEKRKVFRQEKIKFTVGDSHIVDDSIEKSIRKTELHLRKLAVQIIVEEQNEVNTLIPSATSFKSDREREEKEKQLNESGIRFGLLDEKSEGNTTQFLHRTYAEYVLADYIYNGFFLQENCHNKLLENESIRKWIVEKFFMEDKYNGVRIFFDSMLKDIINEEWKNRIKQRKLPDRLLTFAYLLCDQRKKENWALHVASEGRNANICLLILDCFNVVQLAESEIQSAIISAVKYPIEQRSDVFHLILNYFNDASDEQLRKMLKILFNSNIWSSLNNTQVEQENLKHFLDFMYFKANQKKLSWIKIDDLKNMAIFFVRYDYYEYYNVNQLFLQIVLLVCFEDNDIIYLMKTAIIEYIYSNNWKIARIEKMLTILQKLERPNVLPELSRLVLVRKSETFNQDGNGSDYLLEMGMTGLYRAAFNADLKQIEKEIGCSLENPEPETNSEVFRLIVNASEDDEITPLYVAAAYGHENLCQKIFRFFKEREKLLDEILIDAIEYENVLMIKTILKSVKSIWGQNVLLQLLQPVISKIYTYKNHERIFDTVIGIAIQDDENGYQHLNELAFKNEDSLMMICNVNHTILKGMIDSVGGFDIWAEGLMDISTVAWAFILFSIGDFLDKLNKLGHIPKLIDVLTTLRPSQNKEGAKRSYWSDFVKYEYSREVECFIKLGIKQFNENDLKTLLIARDENNVVVLFQFLIREGRDCFERNLSNLPKKLNEEIQDLWKEETPQLVNHFFSSPNFLATLDGLELLNAIDYYLENGNEEQLSKFSQVVDVHQLGKVISQLKAKNIKDGLEKCRDLARNLNDKLDDNTAANYNSVMTL